MAKKPAPQPPPAQRNTRTTPAKPRGGRMPPGKPGQDAVIAERQLRVAELRKAGLSFRAIARTVGCDAATACRDMKAVMTEVINLRNEVGEEWREMELERLDAIMAGLWPKVRAGDAFACDIARKVSESRRKLLGLDAPTKVAPTSPDGERPYTGIDLSALTDEELEAFATLVQKGTVAR